MSQNAEKKQREWYLGGRGTVADLIQKWCARFGVYLGTPSTDHGCESVTRQWILFGERPRIICPCWCIKSHCLYMPCTGVSDVTNKGYIGVRVKCHLLVEVFASRLFEQKKVCLITWLFSSEALKGVQSLNCSCKFIFVDFYSSDVILILWSDFKMTLIAWFNSILIPVANTSAWDISDYLLNKFVVPQYFYTMARVCMGPFLGIQFSWQYMSIRPPLFLLSICIIHNWGEPERAPH